MKQLEFEFIVDGKAPPLGGDGGYEATMRFPKPPSRKTMVSWFRKVKREQGRYPAALLTADGKWLFWRKDLRELR